MLASLEATLPRQLAVEIILIDDGSTDGTRAWLATLDPARYRVLLNERNLGYAAANNRAIAVARGKFLALLNSDLELTPGWLEPMLAVHRSLGSRAGLIGNVQRQVRTGEIDHAGIIVGSTGKPEHLRHSPAWIDARSWRLYSVPAVTGACMLVKRALWDQLGGFDEAYLNGGEDIDLCLRARAAGRENAVALRSVIRHHVSASPGRKRRDEENSRRLMLRWQREFATAADYPTRTWCRETLQAALAAPQSRDYQTVLACLFHLLRLARAPWAATAKVVEGQQRERARWCELFGPEP
jgi:GT2 family glycosyltransferase